MPVTRDIAASYLRPQQVIARKLADGVREDRALAYIMGACALLFVAQWPLLSRQAHLDGSVPLDQLLGGALMGWVILAPLFFYAMAAVVHVLGRIMGGKGTWFSARLALFWSLLAVTPVMLLHGLTLGFIGPDTPQSLLTGLVVVFAFFWLWGNALFVTEWSAHEET